jgi:hypothetical protein
MSAHISDHYGSAGPENVDPVPEIGREELTGVLGMHREEFLQFLLGKKNLRTYTSSYHPGPAVPKS